MTSFEFDTSEVTEKNLTITELTREIKFLLENSLPIFRVIGEISNFLHHPSGHIYFSLKDEGSQITCVFWRSRNVALFFTPQDGMKVVVQGQVTVYEKRGNYQLDVLQMQPAGIGELQMAFEQLKARLNAEGLFDQAHKKAIPEFPATIGIVTALSGAAIQDMIQILTRRFPPIEIIVRPTRVQGEGAAEEIARAMDEFNEYGRIDLMIVGRGGGSIEDLWAFNEEIVARAIYNSRIPIISAVGHEIDFCISDFVADLRAPTPSAAAELAVPDARELRLKIDSLVRTAFQLLSDQIEQFRQQLRYFLGSYGFRQPVDLVREYSRRLDELVLSLDKSIRFYLTIKKERLNTLEKRLLALNPSAILARGYSICYLLPTKQVVNSAELLHPDEKIEIQFSKGSAISAIEKINHGKDS
ncbi:exodeoxyribonuclease VII large subunit [candidate division KSB1 bacterium]|nr:exodeoxyribonuclease VII large subunit [candidate division KSB1 bacterium]